MKKRAGVYSLNQGSLNRVLGVHLNRLLITFLNIFIKMHAKTTVARSKSFKHDRIWLNGKEENITNPRLVNCLREIRKRTQSEDKVHICSENNFPTAAGLASSAAGYACLGKSLYYLRRFLPEKILPSNFEQKFWHFCQPILVFQLKSHSKICI